MSNLSPKTIFSGLIHQKEGWTDINSNEIVGTEQRKILKLSLARLYYYLYQAQLKDFIHNYWCPGQPTGLNLNFEQIKMI